MFVPVGVVYGKVARYSVIIKYKHNVTGVGAVPEALSDAPFYEGHHGRPVDLTSDRIDVQNRVRRYCCVTLAVQFFRT